MTFVIGLGELPISGRRVPLGLLTVLPWVLGPPSWIAPQALIKDLALS